MKNAVVLADWKGKTGLRCKDGDYRRRPWFGTYPECAQFFTARGAKRVANNLWKRWTTPDKVLILFNVEEVRHSNRGIEVVTDDWVYVINDDMSYRKEYKAA